MPSDYDYIQRQYGKTYTVGQRVRHTVTGKVGQVRLEDKGAGNYIQVRFDDRGFDLPCHPDELEVIDAHA